MSSTDDDEISMSDEDMNSPAVTDDDSEEAENSNDSVTGNANANASSDDDSATVKNAEDANSNDSGTDDDFQSHKKSLSKLKDIDPEFYQFLETNDKRLLQFNLSDDDAEEGSADDATEEQLHKPSGDDKLHVASDESDLEDEEGVRDERIITLKMLKGWQNQVQTDKSNKTLVSLAHAFHAALVRVAPPDDDQQTAAGDHFYKVDGSAVFNGVIQLCVIEFGPAVRRFLGLTTMSKLPPHKCRRFSKVKGILKGYFSDLLKLLSGVTSANIQTVLLKHLHYMSPLIVSFPNTAKSTLKRLIQLWGTADDGVRVIAFFCILRIVNSQSVHLLATTLKSMYLTYVTNSKFVSVNTLASINFMRRSLVEMFALDVNLAYQQVFLYIRQLAIHLRNAITMLRKEHVQTVYNWQYINSLRLWGNLLTVTFNKPQLQQLIYPFVQVCFGVLKLSPTAQYYPLRFHVTQILIDLSKDTGVFVPVLPFILDVLTSYDFNKKHQKVSMKPLNFTCLLHLSKSQLTENGFKDTVIDTIYGQLLEYLSEQSSTIAFPDISLICVIQIKQFLKKCSNANYKRKLKQVLDKIEQSSKFIEAERRKLTFNITDFKQIAGWEAQIKNKGTPLTTYFTNWHKLHTIKKNKQLTNNEELGDYKLPQLKNVNRKVVRGSKKSSNGDDGPVELFPSDSSDNDDDFANGDDGKRRKRGKRGGKNVNKRVKSVDTKRLVEDFGGDKDIVQDLNINDW